jgi:hypothetical protein
MPCDCCGEGVHRDCAGLTKNAYKWNRGWICQLCRLTRLDQTYEMRSDLPGLDTIDHERRRKLMRAANVIRSKAWADGSWGAMAYHIQRVISFEQQFAVPVLPLTTEGMMMYFTYLAEEVPTWRAMRSARTAIRAWHIVAGLADPFLDPERLMFLTGLKRTVTLYSRKKLGLTLQHILTLLKGVFTDQKTPYHLKLRDATWIILGFFGFRRHSEVVLCTTKGEEKGLRMRDVTFFPETRHIRLFIRRMKNDPHGKGHYVWLSPETSSEVPIYDIFSAYAQSTGLDPMSELAFIQGSAAGRPFDGRRFYQFRSRLKELMRRHLAFSPVELADYSAHSLRRGGVTHAYRRGVHWDLLNVHGSWLGGTAITGYRLPSEDQLCSVSAAM